nr:two-component system sensor histidine kinase/response regulator, putative [Tanacetum cinerariifolium]
LEELDRTVRCVDSGAKALACMTSGAIGLVLMDVQMPGMDGFEVARRMRADPDTRFTPIIFISGMRQTDAVLTQGYTAGAVDFMTKPVHPAMLLHKARACPGCFVLLATAGRAAVHDDPGAGHVGGARIAPPTGSHDHYRSAYRLAEPPWFHPGLAGGDFPEPT